MRGRPPKPTRLKLLEGNPGKRRIPKNEPRPVPTVTKPDVVAESADASREWDRVLRAMPPGFYAEADVPVLAVYALSYALFVAAWQMIEAEGTTATGSTGQPVAHPAVGVMDRMAGRMLQAGASLGFSPVARARLSSPMPPFPDPDPDDDDRLSDLLRG